MAFFDFDEMFGDSHPFNSNFMKRIQKEIDEIENAIKNNELKGEWKIEKIDKPDVKGFIIQGHFWTDKPLEPFEPPKPLRRPPLPTIPFQTPNGTAEEENREPLTDVLEEETVVKIYAELPGEEKEDIKLNFIEEKLEVKAKKFYKIIDLPTKNIDREKVTTKYKNGVLEITIPKKKTFKPTYQRV